MQDGEGKRLITAKSLVRLLPSSWVFLLPSPSPELLEMKKKPPPPPPGSSSRCSAGITPAEQFYIASYRIMYSIKNYCSAVSPCGTNPRRSGKSSQVWEKAEPLLPELFRKAGGGGGGRGPRCAHPSGAAGRTQTQKRMYEIIAAVLLVPRVCLDVRRHEKAQSVVHLPLHRDSFLSFSYY